ncbi:hypothetical protein HHI36_016165 [Cryptolaemus montrouzieri]|uniref:Uncharacterized protein n=1 Tax=Cryptolaemus montrouzieri TaxID=559131 RepID=A0ABD2NIS4_9CUCU
MEEDGLGAIRDVILNIDDQDQKVWRQNASRKYWKEEIKQLEEQTKPYEVQIEKLKPDAPYRSTEGITQLLEDETKHQVQVYHLLQNLTSAKQSEIEMARREMKSWDENYREVVSEFERVLEQRKSFYEATNHYYKKLRQCETANKLTLVEQNMWKAQVFSKTKSLEQLKNIKKQIMQKTIVKFAAANIRIKKNDSLNSLLTKAADKKKELVGILFEVQETLKRRILITTRGQAQAFFPIW